MKLTSKLRPHLINLAVLGVIAAQYSLALPSAIDTAITVGLWILMLLTVGYAVVLGILGLINPAIFKLHAIVLRDKHGEDAFKLPRSVDFAYDIATLVGLILTQHYALVGLYVLHLPVAAEMRKQFNEIKSTTPPTDK